MPRTAPGRSICPRLATIGPGLLALGLAGPGCSDDTPRVGSADMAASIDAAKQKKGGYPNFVPRGGDFAPEKTRGLGTIGRPGGSKAGAQGQKR